MKKLHLNNKPVFVGDAKENFAIQRIIQGSNIEKQDIERIFKYMESLHLSLQDLSRNLENIISSTSRFEIK